MLSLSACFDEFGTFDPGGQGSGAPEDLDVPGNGSGGASAAGNGSGAGDASGGGSAEDCVNGQDDDGDALADCADLADCAGHTCIALDVPEGWSGPVKLRNDSEAACDPAYPEPGPTGSAFADGNPCGCSCGAVTGRDCGVTLTAFTDATCSTAGTPSTLTPPSTCNLMNAPATLAATAATSFTGGSCTAQREPEASFISVATCAMTVETASSAGCSAGELCLRPPGPEERLCIHQVGDAVCPPGPFEARIVLFQEPLDSTTCSAEDCSCGPPEGGDCTGAIDLASGACGSATVRTVAPSSACQPFGAPTDIASFDYDGQAQGGACGVIVQIDPSNFGAPTTLCCEAPD